MTWLPDWVGWTQALVQLLALPEVGLGAIFVVALVSATLVPMGSEPAVWALVSLRPELFWPAVGVATLGNTLGGVITWWMGRAAHDAWARARRTGAAEGDTARSPAHARAHRWVQRWGAAACLLSWLPVVGDPLCAVAGWCRLPFWPCVACMAVGKGARYVMLTWLLMRWPM